MKFTINNWYQKRQIQTFHFPLKRYSEEVELFQKEEHDETEGARPRNDGHQTRDLPNKRLWNVWIKKVYIFLYSEFPISDDDKDNWNFITLWVYHGMLC